MDNNTKQNVELMVTKYLKSVANKNSVYAGLLKTDVSWIADFVIARKYIKHLMFAPERVIKEYLQNRDAFFNEIAGFNNILGYYSDNIKIINDDIRGRGLTDARYFFYVYSIINYLNRLHRNKIDNSGILPSLAAISKNKSDIILDITDYILVRVGMSDINDENLKHAILDYIDKNKNLI